MDKNVKSAIDQQISFLEKNKDRITIDGDTHLTNIDSIHPELKKRFKSSYNYYHGKPLDLASILFEMQQAEVDMCLIWQNPAATFYSGKQTENYISLLKANQYIHKIFIEHPEKFIPAGWIDPVAIGETAAIEMAELFVKEYGFPIVKMNPAQNQFLIDSDMVMRCTERIVSLGAIPAFHFGADTPFTPLEGLANIANNFQSSPIVAVHMGGGGAGYIEAEELYLLTRKAGVTIPNLKFVMSAKRDTHMESDFITFQLAGEPYCYNLICASDAPYGRMSWNFGGFRKIFESLKKPNHPDRRIKENPELFTNDTVQNFLGRNMANLILDAYLNIEKNRN